MEAEGYGNAERTYGDPIAIRTTGWFSAKSDWTHATISFGRPNCHEPGVALEKDKKRIRSGRFADKLTEMK